MVAYTSGSTATLSKVDGSHAGLAKLRPFSLIAYLLHFPGFVPTLLRAKEASLSTKSIYLNGSLDSMGLTSRPPCSNQHRPCHRVVPATFDVMPHRDHLAARVPGATWPACAHATTSSGGWSTRCPRPS